MKYLFMTMMLLTFFSCGEPESTEPEIEKGEHFGKCLSNEEATALGAGVKCSAPGCVCMEDVHGKEHRDYAHCHSDASKCD